MVCLSHAVRTKILAQCMELGKFAIVMASRNSVVGTAWVYYNALANLNAKPIDFIGMRQSVTVSMLNSVMVSRLATSNSKTKLFDFSKESCCQIMNFSAIFWLPSIDSK